MAKFSMLKGLLAALLIGFAGAASASFHLWQIHELYSNADGTIQFVEFEVGNANGEQFLTGHMLVNLSGADRTTYTFATDLPSGATANHSFLVATQGFANLGIVAPDYIIPNGFLTIGGGTLQYGASGSGPYATGPVDSVTYGPLPTDGVNSIDSGGVPHTNSPTNFAGATGSVMPAATVTPQTGWWWNPAQSGRGFFIEQQGNDLFFAGYLYADNGRALWTISAGSKGPGSTYSGSLLTFGSGQTLTGPYQAPMQGPSLGNLTLQFTDSTHATMTWPGGTMPIVRTDYAGLSLPVVANAPETGWWWNAAESGRGFSLETQGSTMFIAGYMYDASGNPVWYISVGTLNAAGLYSGSWMQFANGQMLTGPYQPPTMVNGNVGTVTIQFSDRQNGTMTLPDMRVIAFTRFHF
jgi:hypothetical protein